MDECKDGGNVILNTLWAETSKLRSQLVEALNAEKKAVHNALRSHRDFQLALQGQVPAVITIENYFENIDGSGSDGKIGILQ